MPTLIPFGCELVASGEGLPIKEMEAMLTALAITEQREQRILLLEQALCQHKLWLSEALDEIARLKADQNERGRLT